MLYCCIISYFFFFFMLTAPTAIYTLSLHDALPICSNAVDDDMIDVLEDTGDDPVVREITGFINAMSEDRSEEHTSELQSRLHLVCRLLLEKKKKNHQA